MQQVPLASQGTPDASRDTENAQRISALVQQAKLGDVEAFATLYRLHAPRIYDYAARRLAGKQEAEEATQEIFFRAVRGIAGCRDNAGFTGWLFGIARFVIADVHRGRGRQRYRLPHDGLGRWHGMSSQRGSNTATLAGRCLSDV